MAARVEHHLPIALIAGALVVAMLALSVATGAADGIDRTVIDIVRSDALRDALAPLRYATELGATWAVTMIAVFVLFVGFLVRRPWLGVAASATILLASIGNSLLKLGFARARPDLLDPIVVEHGFSFPSGHAMLSMVAYGLVAVLVTRSPVARWAKRAALVLLGIAVLSVGVSRVYLGVHYATDVLAGWIIGLMIVLVFARVSRAVSRSPAAGAADVDPAARRSDPPGPA